MSTATSTTRLLANGEYEMNVFSQRVNYLDESGEWAPIDTALVEPDGQLGPDEAPAEVEAGEFVAQNAAGLATVLVPEDPATAPAVVSVDPGAEDFVADADSTGAAAGSAGGGDRQWVSVKMQGLAGAPTIEGDTATYDEVEGADAVELTSTVDGLKEVIFLDTEPAGAQGSVGAPGRDEQGRLAFRYRISASNGLTARETPHGDIEFIPTVRSGEDGDRTPVFVIPRGNMFDSAETVMVGDAEAEGPAYTNDVDYELTPVTPDVDAGDDQGVGDVAAGGWDLVVRPNMDWLAAAERVYPVMVDPTLRTFAPQRDCALFQDAPTTSRCGDNQQYLRAGKLTGGTGIADRRRAIFRFDISGLRSDATITNANLQLHMAPNQTEPTQEAAYVVQKTGQAFTNAATWRSPRGGSTTWFGGGATGPEMGLTRLSGNGNPGPHWRYFNVNEAARDWHAGQANNGLVLKQRNENVRSEVAFRSTSTQNDAGLRPRLNVNFTLPGESDPTLGGERDFWQYEDRELNDRMTAKVNVGNGNLLLENQDASVAGRAGWDMAWTRYYNSVAHTQGGSALGAGWSHGFGGPGSVRLGFPNEDGGGERSKVAFWGPSGYRAVFERDGASDYTREKPGIRADLSFQANENRYELKWFDESKYYFDRTGQLTSTQDKNDNNNTLSMTYRADGRLGSVTDTRNRVLFFTYLTAGGTNTGLIETAEVRRPGPAGNPTGGQPMVRWRYGYDRTTGTIAQLKTSKVEYYDNDDTIRNGAGPDTARDTNATTDGNGGTIGATTTYNYDTRGKLTSVVDARQSRTEFGYDSADTPKLTQMTRVLGQDQPASTTQFTYFPNADPGPNNTCKRDDEGGGDADAETRTHVDGERSDVDDTTRYCVDVNDRVLRTTDARGKKRSSSWSDNSNVEQADLSGTGSGQQMYDYSYDDQDENLEKTQSPEGSTTGATYSDDSAHNPAAVSGDDNGGGQNESSSWRYRYDDNDNLIRARSGEDQLRPGRDDLNITYEYCWTPSGQISRIMPGDGDGNASNNDSDTRNCSPGSQGDDTIFTYNGAGELTNVNRPAGGDQTFTYDNLSRIATVTDGKGVRTSYVYDAMDRVVEARHTDNPDSPDPDPEQTVTWKYDTAGNITTMTNIVNTEVPSTPIPSKTFTYDALNRLKKESPQNPSDETTYDYDPAGNVVKIEVAAERQAGLDATFYTYNPVNNVTSIDDQRPGNATVTFAYDDRDNRIETIFPIVNADGTTSPNSLVHKAAFNDDSNATCMWSYRQSSNNPTGDCNAVKGHNRLITYRGYDYKNPDLVNLPGTDKDERNTSTKYEQIDLGNRTTRFTYDAIKRLEQATTRDGATSDDTVVRSFDYEYSNRSNMTEKNVSTDLGTTPPGLETGRWQYAYNNGDEICSSIRGQANAPGLGCEPDTGPAGRTVYTHDDTGNMLTAEQKGTGASAPLDGLELEYNLPRQTTTITPPGGATSATSGPQAYDGVEQDRRTAAGNTTMSYGHAGQVTAQNNTPTAGTGATGQIFVRDPAGDLVAMLSRNPANPGTITDVDYYLLDDQKSVMATHDGRGVLDGDGLIRHLYEPYGDMIRTWTQPNAGTPNANGNSPGDGSLATASAPAADDNPFSYVSGYHDRVTGLIKFGTRYYLPQLARWTQHDPQQGELSEPLTLQRFQYVEQNPIGNTDQSGRVSQETSEFIGTTVLGVGGFGLGVAAALAPVSIAGGIALAATFLVAGVIIEAGTTYG